MRRKKIAEESSEQKINERGPPPPKARGDSADTSQYVISSQRTTTVCAAVRARAPVQSLTKVRVCCSLFILHWIDRCDRCEEDDSRRYAMWRFVVCFVYLAVVLLPAPCKPLAQGAGVKFGQECDIHDVNQNCGTNERCAAKKENATARCECQGGYEYKDHVCTYVEESTEAPPASDDPSTARSASGPTDSTKSGVAKFLIIPTCLVLVGALAYYGARHYKLFQWFRQVRQNRYGSVLVTRDDTDEDDAPQLA